MEVERSGRNPSTRARAAPLQRIEWNGSAYGEEGAGIDCNEVIHRPADAPIAQLKAMCFAVIPAADCRDEL